MADYKLDIFQTLSAVDQRDKTWLSKQPVEAQKGFSPLVFMRWLSSVNTAPVASEWHILAVNEFLNKGFWELSDYPDLLYKLGCVAGSGKKQRHDWIPMATMKRSSNKALDFLGEINPSLKEQDLEILLGLHTVDTFNELLLENGVQKDEEKELLVAFKKYFK